MRITKNELSRILRVLGKVVCLTSPVELYRLVRFVGSPAGCQAMATDGVETVAVTTAAVIEDAIDFCVPFKELKELIRKTRQNDIFLSGDRCNGFTDFKQNPGLSIVDLPADFSNLLALAAPVVDRRNYRRVLQGVNLSGAGITVTDGKQLLHLPCPLALSTDITIPFPAALLTMKLDAPGVIRIGEQDFVMEIAEFQWQGKLLTGPYPNWRNVIPGDDALNYSITLKDPAAVIDWVKNIPIQKTTNGVEFNVTANGVTLISCIQPEYQLAVNAVFSGERPRAVLALDRDILLRMLLQGYTTFKANSDGLIPVSACGGAGQFIAMPIRTLKPHTTQPKQEENEMENETTAVAEQTNPVANPLDELGIAIEEFKGKIRVMLDESVALSRKVKEVALQQKQKERDFIQARRAIERIRMAI